MVKLNIYLHKIGKRVFNCQGNMKLALKPNREKKKNTHEIQWKITIVLTRVRARDEMKLK
ncbi:hypothetical protein BLOT_004292 [Blomia tropicalis]|nr:hypothetical protein BLOT_004292 [Blomia tropicalis]